VDNIMNGSKLFGIAVVSMLGAINWQLYGQGLAIEAVWQRLDDLTVQIADMQDQIDSATGDAAAAPSTQPMQCGPEKAPGLQI
jgi:hypothetical protein